MLKSIGVNKVMLTFIICLFCIMSSKQALAAEYRLKAQLIAERFTDIASGIDSLVLSIDAKNGALIKKGATLVAFDCDRLKASATIAKAHIKVATAKLSSLTKLYKLHSASLSEVNLAAAEEIMAKAELTSVNAQIKYCKIKAPYKTRVVQKYIQPYQYVQPGTPLLHIYDPDSLQVQFVAPSSGLTEFRENKPFSIHLDELNIDLTGRIIRTGGSIDPVSQTIQVYGELDSHPETLLEGMSGFVTLQ